MNFICKNAISIFFADDSNLFKNGKDLSLLEKDINELLARVSEWLKVNKLSLNIKKTHYMIFTKKKCAKPEVKLTIDEEILFEVSQTKFLGVIIDNQLSWKNHVNVICGKIARGIGIMLRARSVINKSTLITLYYSFVYPYYVYCNHIWGTSSTKNMKRLFILQKKAVRIICHANPRSHSDPLFKELKFLNIWQINKYLIGQFMYKHFNKKLPALFSSYFKRSCDVHLHNTRQASSYYQLPIVRTKYCELSIHFRGPSIWNNIMKNKVNPYVTIDTFKKKIKELLLRGVI